MKVFVAYYRYNFMILHSLRYTAFCYPVKELSVQMSPPFRLLHWFVQQLQQFLPHQISNCMKLFL